MADSTDANEPRGKRRRCESVNDAEKLNESDIVDSTTNDTKTDNEKSSPLVDIEGEMEINSEKMTHEDGDIGQPGTNTDTEKSSPLVEVEGVAYSSEKDDTPSTDEGIDQFETDIDTEKTNEPVENKDEKSSPTDPEDVFDDSYYRSSDEDYDDDDGDQAAKKKEIPLEPFNLDEEKAMGTFDKDFNYTWKTKSREPTDAWLANEGAKPFEKNIKRPVSKEEPESAPPNKEELRSLLKEISVYMQVDETVQVAINRMSNPVAASASARLALKKAGGSYKVSDSNNSAKLHEFLNLLTKFPLTADIYSLSRLEILEIVVSEEKLDKFKNKTYPPLVIDITSGTDSDDSEEEAEVPCKKSRKMPVTMSISSSDEEEEEGGDDEDGGKKQRQRTIPANGSGANEVEVDMFAE